LKKILHLPTSTSGYSNGLSEIEIKNGLNSKVLITDRNKFFYKSDYSLFSKNPIKFFFNKLLFVLNNRKSFDVYHFNFGTSLFDYFFIGLPLLDLKLYRGKKIFTFNGSDARGWSNKIYNDAISSELDSQYSKNKKIIIRRFFNKLKLKIVNKYADTIFTVNPDLMNYLPENTKFLPYAISNWNNINKVENYLETNNKIKILHAPTNRGLKGSSFIIESINKLKKKYNNIELVLVENHTNEEALKLYSSADILIDQVLIGWYGGVSVEFMKMGKPVAVFIREEDLKFIPSEMAMELKNAIISIDPFNIEQVLSHYIENVNELKIKAKLCYDYVNKWHDPDYIFSLLKKAYL